MGGIEIPQYQAYLPEKAKATGAAVVIFPGGAYRILVANPAFDYQFPVPFLDARRAIRTVRARAAEWGIDPHKVGVMGSSAGGDLATWPLLLEQWLARKFPPGK